MPHVRILPVLGVVYVSDWLELLQCGLTGLLQGVGSASVQFSENNMKEDEIVFRIWDDNSSLHFCISIHISFIRATSTKLLVWLITRVGKRFSDCGKQETCDPGAIFFVRLGFPSLSPSFVRRKPSSTDWQRAPGRGAFRPGPCRLSELVAKHTAGKNHFSCVLEPVDALCALMWCSEVRIQALLPKHRGGNKTWKAQRPRGHGSVPQVRVKPGATLDWVLLKIDELTW